MGRTRENGGGERVSVSGDAERERLPSAPNEKSEEVGEGPGVRRRM